MELDLAGTHEPEADLDIIEHPHDNAVMTDFPYCPTCGQRTMLGTSPEWLLTHFESKIMQRLIASLCEARRECRTLSLPELCRKVFRDEPGGPPISAPNTICAMITQRRIQMIEKGWMIVGPKTTGTGYALVPFAKIVKDYP